jgi:cobalt-precorrin 5A hydrolase/precorrin-3B C17-methyltransferase
VSGVLAISVTEAGRRVAERLPYEHAHGDPAKVLADRWEKVDGFVVVLALGATVRLVAPLLRDKASDPAVVCVDDAATFAVSVLGGHGAGANALATEVARLLGAQAVVTTATDRLDLPALDLLPDLLAEGDVAGVTAALVAGRPVALDNELGWPLPGPITALLGTTDPAPAGRVVVTDRAREQADATVVLRPPSLVVGLGTTSDATASDALDAVRGVLGTGGLSARSLAAVATIDRRAEHPAVSAVADAFDLAVRSFPAAELDTVVVPNPSEVVASAVGTRSVAEAAALAAAGDDAELVVAKTVAGRTTVAVARRARPAGSLHIVGLGPGSAAQRTAEAATAVRHAQVVVGLDAYVEQCSDLLTPSQQIHRFAIGSELERARLALDLAARGARVALVCSGDAGVYAMASPTLDLLDEATARDVEVRVVPGVTAALSAAALLGAPLGHDFLTLSLSDLLTPWELIEARVRAAALSDLVVVVYNPRFEARVRAAALSDLVVVVYNPRSRTRTWQLERTRSILLEHRGPDTVVGVVTDAGRPDQAVRVTTLGQLECAAVNMTTCLVIGSSTTRLRAGRMVTPRGYIP